MANTALQSESAPAKPLTLFDAVNLVDDIRGDVEQLEALLSIIADCPELNDGRSANAIRAAARLAEALAERAGEHSDALAAAFRAQDCGNVAEFRRDQ